MEFYKLYFRVPEETINYIETLIENKKLLYEAAFNPSKLNNSIKLLLLHIKAQDEKFKDYNQIMQNISKPLSVIHTNNQNNQN
jgi:hypothetical protein